MSLISITLKHKLARVFTVQPMDVLCCSTVRSSTVTHKDVIRMEMAYQKHFISMLRNVNFSKNVLLHRPGLEFSQRFREKSF